MEIKKIAVIWFCLIIQMSSIMIIVDITDTVIASTIWVDDSYPSEDPTHKKTIQAGIDAANHGDTVFVYNGTYYENVVVNKMISITGEEKEYSIINGSGNGVVVRIITDWVNITGFTVTGCGTIATDSGIELNNTQNCTVANNIITSNIEYGIHLLASSNNNISANIVTNNTRGISLSSSFGNNVNNNNMD